MPRADFYLIAKDRFKAEPLRLVCELARKAYDANLWTLVLARDAAAGRATRRHAVGHGRGCLHPAPDRRRRVDEEEAAVLIAPPDVDAPLRPLVINLRDAAVEGAFDRVLEVVPADETAREPLRARWTQYKARGLEVNKHDM